MHTRLMRLLFRTEKTNQVQDGAAGTTGAAL